jgi:ABC-type uncharacterized transport system involved in gliding motility auxiliary subunit
MPGGLWKSHSLRNLSFMLVVAAAAVGFGYLAAHYHVQRDLTYNAINSLEPASVEVLQKLNGPITITAFATEQDARLGDIRKIIRDFLSLYQRYKPDITLEFVDPSKEPDKARAEQIRFNGEMVVTYAGRSEHLTKINESILTSTLLRLAHAREQPVMYLDGHGERKLDGIANYDLGSLFGAKLVQNGFHISPLNLAVAQDVPSNVSVLVITQPQVDLMPGEVDKLLRYVDRGGNLFWLIDAEPMHGLERLAEQLGLQLPPGIVIDPAASGMNAPADWSLGTTYPSHAITSNFNLVTAFPSARPLIWNENPNWKHSVLVEVAPRGWVTRKKPADKPRFDKTQDVPGPAVIAIALQRRINDRDQRIVVVGDGAFLANSYAGNGGNVDLGINMLNWLAMEDNLITVQPRPSKDSSLMLSTLALEVISGSFLLGIPLLLGLIGLYRWRQGRA